jgi:uncharacterized protein YqeY
VGSPTNDLIERLQRSITAARSARDRERADTLRSVLSAVQNAGAVPVDHSRVVQGSSPVAGALDGLGAGEVPRRELTAEELLAILDEELAERVTAAQEYRTLGLDEAAERMDREAAVIAELLPAAPVDPPATPCTGSRR